MRVLTMYVPAISITFKQGSGKDQILPEELFEISFC